MIIFISLKKMQKNAGCRESCKIIFHFSPTTSRRCKNAFFLTKLFIIFNRSGKIFSKNTKIFILLQQKTCIFAHTLKKK